MYSGLDFGMYDGWEIVDRPRGRGERERRIYASLNPRGEIVLNAEAFERIKKPASVTLLYNEEKRQIAVKYPIREDRNFFLVRRCGRGRRNLIIRAERMLKQFDISIGQTLIFKDIKLELVGGHPALLLDLDNAKTSGRPKKLIMEDVGDQAGLVLGAEDRH